MKSIHSQAIELKELAISLSAINSEVETVRQLNTRRESLDTARKALQVTARRWQDFSQAGLVCSSNAPDLKKILFHLRRLIEEANSDPQVLITSRFNTALNNLQIVEQQLKQALSEAWSLYCDQVKPVVLPVVLQSLKIQPQRQEWVRQWTYLEKEHQMLRLAASPTTQTIAKMHDLAQQFKSLHEQLQGDDLPESVTQFFERLQYGQATLGDLDDEVMTWMRSHAVLSHFKIVTL